MPTTQRVYRHEWILAQVFDKHRHEPFSSTGMAKKLGWRKEHVRGACRRLCDRGELIPIAPGKYQMARGVERPDVVPGAVLRMQWGQLRNGCDTTSGTLVSDAYSQPAKAEVFGITTEVWLGLTTWQQGELRRMADHGVSAHVAGMQVGLSIKANTVKSARVTACAPMGTHHAIP